VTGSLTDRIRPLSAPIVLLGSVDLSIVLVAGLPAGHPIRVVAGILLFVVLPGIGLELILLRPHRPTAPWERLAIIGALGLAASGLGLVILVVAGTPITLGSVSALCAVIAVFGSIVAVVTRRSSAFEQPRVATVRLAMALTVIVSGALIGSAIGSRATADAFTVLAFEDPIAAGAAMQAAVAQRGAIRIVIESHEAAADEYQLSVVGGAPSPTFLLQPSERRVVEIDVSTAPANDVEIDLLKSGQPYRSLHLRAP
jgi:hypothetical protein